MPLRKALASFVIFGLLFALSTTVLKAATPPIGAVDPNIDQRALDLLAEMSDYLAGAGTMTFVAKIMVETPVNGQLLHFWSNSDVTVKRPDGLKILTKSDSKPSSVYFDGKTLTVFSPKDNMYAAIAAPATLDDFFPFAVEKAGIHTTYSDILTSDPFDLLTEGLTTAFSAGQSTIDGTLCDHLAFKGDDVEWEIWIASGDEPLPLMMIITYLEVPDKPRFILHYSNWQFNVPVPTDTFVFTQPAGAKKIGFHQNKGAVANAGGDKK